MKLLWTEWNKEHIKKHQVTVAEVEEAYLKSDLKTAGKRHRTIIISRIDNGRMLTLVLSTEHQKQPFVVSARDASKKERKLYYVHNQT